MINTTPWFREILYLTTRYSILILAVANPISYKREGSYRDRRSPSIIETRYSFRNRCSMCSIANHVLINQRVNGAGEEKTEYLCREIYLSRFISTPRFDFLPRFQRVNNFCPETFPPREIGETYVNTGWPGIHVESTLIREWPTINRPATNHSSFGAWKNKNHLFENNCANICDQEYIFDS